VAGKDFALLASTWMDGEDDRKGLIQIFLFHDVELEQDI
jgi:hypothetical protein